MKRDFFRLSTFLLSWCSAIKRHMIILVPPEIIIQSVLTRFSSQILLNCTIIARPLISAKWKQNRIEIQNHIKRLEINDYTIQLILFLQVNFNQKSKKQTLVLYLKDWFIELYQCIWDIWMWSGKSIESCKNIYYYWW